MSKANQVAAGILTADPNLVTEWYGWMGWGGLDAIPSHPSPFPFADPLAVCHALSGLLLLAGSCLSFSPFLCPVLSCLEPPYHRRRAGSTAGSGHTPLVSNVTSAGLLVRLLQRVCKKANLLVPCRCMCTSLEQSRRTDRDLLARRGAVELLTSSSLLFCGWRATSGRRTTMW